MRRRILIALSLVAGVACHAPSTLAAWETQVGPAPNLSLPTLGGSQLWADVAWRDRWRVQRHTWTGHHRLLDPQGVRRAWGTLARCRAALVASAEPEAPGTHLVVVLHGLGRTRRSMTALSTDLVDAGWRVAQLSYPSTRASLDTHACDVAAVLAGLEGVTRVSFVTHSLGGVVAREVLGDPDAAWRARVQPRALVQLAPPNQGAELARRLDLPPLRWLMGPSFAALADRRGVWAPIPRVPTTILTGAGGWNPLIHGADDLVVGVEEARLPGAALIVLPDALHTFVMNDARARGAVLAALDERR